MGCRLILNLCQAYHHPRDPDITPPQSIWAATSGVRFHGGPTRVSASVGTWWPRTTRERKNNGVRGVNAALSRRSLGEADAAAERTAEGSGSLRTTLTRKASDAELEEGVYEMHALGASADWAVGEESAGHGDGRREHGCGSAVWDATSALDPFRR